MAYVKHEDLCGAFKGRFLILFFICIVLPVQSPHYSPSFFLRGHTAGNPGTYWFTTRSSHTRICRSCVMYTWCRPFIQPRLCVMHHVGVMCPLESERTEEVPDPSQKLNWSHWGPPGQQGPIQCLPRCVASSSSRRNPPKPPNTSGHPSAFCFPGPHSYPFFHIFIFELVSSYLHLFISRLCLTENYWAAIRQVHSHDRGLSLCNSPFFSFRFWEQLQQLLQNRPLLQQPSRQSHLQVGINRVMGRVLHMAVRSVFNTIVKCMSWVFLLLLLLH